MLRITLLAPVCAEILDNKDPSFYVAAHATPSSAFITVEAAVASSIGDPSVLEEVVVKLFFLLPLLGK
jgi:hypothetical protein